ncbi:hypothetical protein PVAP13_8KG051753 [Panicum virgatum]|uniref:Uncharacterized protein n=1 Tax=Panicum virgatum TaxID=38727 RepID=A0A8T0PPP3_PANVG|nr:hypothetical protein PVAP13_8KG051753 [Panicum virgatum]
MAQNNSGPQKFVFQSRWRSLPVFRRPAMGALSAGFGDDGEPPRRLWRLQGSNPPGPGCWGMWAAIAPAEMRSAASGRRSEGPCLSSGGQ